MIPGVVKDCSSYGRCVDCDLCLELLLMDVLNTGAGGMSPGEVAECASY